MVAFPRQSLIRHLPLGGAALIGSAAAATFLLMPADLLESLVWHSGVAAVLPVAAPPLGDTARAVLAFGGGSLAAAVAWSALFLLFGAGGFLTGAKRREDGIPVVRRADAHPDAPPRRPLSAADLGLPMMAVAAPRVAEGDRPIPADLDLPLAAFDPNALLPVPMEPVRPVAPLAPPPVERIATFALPLAPQGPAPIGPADRAESNPAPTIEALLRRLEQGAGRRRHAIAR